MIHVKNLSINFKENRFPFLEKKSLSIHQGEKILLIGPSGSGKSVLLKAIMGILPNEFINEGSFIVDNEQMDYTTYRHHSIHQRFSAIFQDAVNSLHPYRTIDRQFPFSKNSEMESCCKQFRLQYDQIIQAFSRELSGGQCQRISIMFPFLLTQRDIVIFDEPITDIDPISHKSILKQIKNSFLLKPDKTVIYVTHQHDEISDIPFTRYYLNETEKKGFKSKLACPQLIIEDDDSSEISSIMQVNIPFFKYPGIDHRNFALRHVKFEIKPGDSIGILGESASGKSTVLKMMAGLELPLDSNQILMVNNKYQKLVPLNKINRKKRYGNLQIVFQDNAGSLYENETVEQSLKHIRKIKHISEKNIFHHSKSFFQKLGLVNNENRHSNTDRGYKDSYDNFLKKQVVQLSMGMLRRYCLAKAVLMMNIYSEKDQKIPKVLLLDEISRGLDQQTKNKVIEFLKFIKKEYHMAIVAISHQKEFLFSFCQHFYFMFEGFQIPKAYTRRELSPDALHKIKNTYIRRYFMSCDEPTPYPRNEERPETGCFFQQFYKCPEYRSGCDKEIKEPWVCV